MDNVIIKPGKPITHKEAQALLNRYRKNVKLLLKAIREYERNHPDFKPGAHDLYDKVKGRKQPKVLSTFVDPGTTGFIFSKTEVMSLFKEHSSDYMLVMLGAQPKDSYSEDGSTNDFKENELTVMLIGYDPCKKDDKQMVAQSVGVEHPQKYGGRNVP
jgi:hypothetical protein